jgi:ABC-type polysaccharide/polyol phosphate export permease
MITTDLKRSLKQFRLVNYFSITDLKSQYQRTLIGPWWETISLAIFLFFLSIIWAKVVNEDLNTYLPYLVTSLIIWRFMTVLVGQGTMIFLNSSELIKSFKINLSTLAIIKVYDKCLIFLHHLPIIIFFYLYFKVDVLNKSFLLLFYTVPIFLITCYSVCIILAFFNTRFRDLQSFVSMAMSVMMFFTPILWKADAIGPKANFFIVQPNILYHYIEIIRMPMNGQNPQLLSIILTTIFTFTSFIASQYIIKKYSSRVPIWL